MMEFIPGLELSRRYYLDAIKPILDKEFRGLRYSAAMIGWGSEVLGFDTPLSRDHHWGPRLLLFLKERDFLTLSKPIVSSLSNKLPYEFMSYPTSFGKPDSKGVRLPLEITTGKVDHMVQLFTIRSFFYARLRIDPYKRISIKEWLTFPQQRLLELTSGAVYHDGLGELERLRQKFNYYPHDVWLYLLAAQWKKISQEEAFVGRTGEMGDELGSRIIATRIVQELIKLCFLMEKQYAPYSKWLGTAFSRLKIAKKLSPAMIRVLSADNWKHRERSLSTAYSIVSTAHNKLDITPPMPTKTSNYFERPFKVIHADRFAEEIKKRIEDPAVKKLKADLGSVDQFSDDAEVVTDLDLCRALEAVYG